MEKSTYTALLILLLCGAGCAQNMVRPQFKPTPIPEEQVTARMNLSWANRAWTGNNAPYKQIRADIDAAIQKGHSADDLRQQYGIAAQQKPKDALAQFAWAYAARIASRSRTITEGKSHDDLWGVPEAIGSVSDPHAYDFYRLRFLLEGGKKLVPLGKRLLAVNSADVDVRAQMARISPNQSTALAYCGSLIRDYPTSARFRGLLADIYVASWEKSRDESDRQKAIAATNDFLKMSLPNDKRLGDAQYLLKLLSAPPNPH